MSSRPRGPYRPGHYKAPTSPANPEKPEHAKRDAYDWVTLWTAIIGVAIVAASTAVTAYQAIVTKQQLDAALSQQRAWLKVEASPRDLDIDAAGAHIRLEVRLTNVGTLPAAGVWTGATAVIHEPISDQKPEPPRSGFCSGDHASSRGETIFPGETVVRRELITISRAELVKTGLPEVGFTVKTCAVYFDHATRRVRHTDRTISLTKAWSVDDMALGFRIGGHSVKAADINPWPFPSGNTAN